MVLAQSKTYVDDFWFKRLKRWQQEGTLGQKRLTTDLWLNSQQAMELGYNQGESDYLLQASQIEGQYGKLPTPDFNQPPAITQPATTTPTMTNGANKGIDKYIPASAFKDPSLINDPGLKYAIVKTDGITDYVSGIYSNLPPGAKLYKLPETYYTNDVTNYGGGTPELIQQDNQSQPSSSVLNLLRRLYPDRLKPLASPDQELLFKEYQRTGGQLNLPNWQLAGSPLRPEMEFDYLTDLTKRASIPEAETILRGLGISEPDITQIIGAQKQQDEFNVSLNTIPALRGHTIDSLTQMIQTDPQQFLTKIQAGGLTSDKQHLLQTIGFTSDEIAKIFPQPQIRPLEGTMPYVPGFTTGLPKPKPPMITTPAGNKVAYQMTDAEWQSMTPAEKVFYGAKPQEWLEQRADWAKLRVESDRIKIIAESLGFPTKMDSTTDEMMLFVNTALWILPVPLEKLGMAGYQAGKKLLPKAAQEAIKPIEAFLQRIAKTRIGGVKPEVKVSPKVAEKIQAIAKEPLPEVKAPEVTPTKPVEPAPTPTKGAVVAPEKPTPAPEVTKLVPTNSADVLEIQEGGIKVGDVIKDTVRTQAGDVSMWKFVPTDETLAKQIGGFAGAKTPEEALLIYNEKAGVAIPKAEAVPEVNAYQEAVNKGVPITESKPPEIPANPPAQPPTKPPVAGLNAPTPNDPLPIVPTKSGENVIGLRTIEPGLTRSETIGNFFKRIIGKTGVDVVDADPLSNPAFRERARVRTAIESNANVLGTKAENQLKVFTFDKQGRIPELADVIPEIGAPTIQDVAARLPVYRSRLTEAQIKALSDIKEAVTPYRNLLSDVGVDVRARGDVMDGGFYLPRGKAGLEGVDDPFKVGGGRGGKKKGFEKPAIFDSMAQGIDAGYEYSPIGESLTSYAFDAGTRATDQHVANYFLALTDDTGRLLGETPKMRMLRQNSGIAQVVENIKGNLAKLKSNIGALTDRQEAVIDLWANDPNFAETSEVIISLQDALSTMKGGRPAQTLNELKSLFRENIDALKALKPDYDRAMHQAMVTPRDQGVIILPALQGRTFPNEIANAANIILGKEGKTTGALSGVVNTANAFNNFYRGMRATLDNSSLGIQGLLGMYGQQKAYAQALKVNLQAWGVGGDKILGKFLTEFDATAVANGRATSSIWSRSGLHLGGATSEFELGRGVKLGKLPVVRQANRAFGYFGDALRLEWADGELTRQLAKGRSLEAIRVSGDLDRIANAANVMTGWAPKKAGGSLGDLVLFAPRFLESRLETVVKAGMGLRPNATLDQQMARNSILKLIGFGTILTVAGNELAGEMDTDFRPVVDGKRNPKFMRIKYQGNYYSMLGTWDSLAGMFINIGTGKPLQALRSMGSGLTTSAFDIITGKDYNYKAVGSGMGGTEFDAGKLAVWMGNSLLPFSVGQLPKGITQVAGGIIEEDTGEAIGGVVNIASQITGFKSYPAEDFKTNKKRLGLPVDDSPALLSNEIQIYDTPTYYKDTLAKLGQYNPDEVIGNKDYPADTQAIVQAKELDREQNAIPTRALKSLNTDSSKGDTFKELYSQWQERQKITDPQKLKEFDDKYPDADKGNMSQQEFVLLSQRAEIIDKARLAEFDKAHPELSANKRNDWLKSHPKENAELAIHGQAHLLTKEAYTIFNKRVKELDYPNSSLPDQSLPPEGSVDNYFKYQDMVAEDKNASWEAQLMLSKDTKLRDFLGLKPADTPIASLELKVKNRANFDKLAGFSDETSPDYITDEKKRAEAVKKFKTDNPAFVDDTRRIDAIEKGTDKLPTPDAIIKSHVDYGKLIDKEGVGSSSAETMLYRVDNPEYDKWRQDTNLWGDNALKPIDQTKIPIWRIDVKYAKEDTEYKAIKNPLPSEQARLRDEYLAKNEAYRKDRRRREAYGLTNSLTGAKFPLSEVENYVAYWELPTKGFRQERMSYDDFGNLNAFGKARRDIMGKDIKPFNKIPDVAYDDLYDQYPEQFDELERLSNNSPQYNIEDIKARDKARGALRLNPDGSFTEFGLAEIRRDGYGLFVPDDQIDNYVSYKTLPKGQYEDDWFLQEHPDYYQQVYLNPDIYPDHKRKDYRLVPDRRVYAKYIIYDNMFGKVERQNYRFNNPDLEDWLFLTGKVTTRIKEERANAELTPRERGLQERERRQEEFERNLAGVGR